MVGASLIANAVCRAYNIESSDWELYKTVVRDNIRIRRANCNTAVKKAMFGALHHFTMSSKYVTNYNLIFPLFEMQLPWMIKETILYLDCRL